MSQAGYTPIQLYYSTTAAAVPTAGNLASGELAINITDGKLYYKSNAGVVTLLAGSSTGPAAGSNTQVQFNNSGVLGGAANMLYTSSALSLAQNLLFTDNTYDIGASGATRPRNLFIGTNSYIAGKELIGSVTTTNNLRVNESFGVVNVSNNSAGMALTSYSGTGAGFRSLIDFNRSRGTTDGSMTAVAISDLLGSVIYRGADGTSFQDGAAVIASVDNTVTTGAVPTALSFWTTTNGTIANRYSISSAGAHTWNAGGGMVFSSIGQLVVNGSGATAGSAFTLQESAGFPSALSMINRNNNQTWTVAVDANAIDDKILGFINTTSSLLGMGLTNTGNLFVGGTSATGRITSYTDVASQTALTATSITSTGATKAAIFTIGANNSAYSGGFGLQVFDKTANGGGAQTGYGVYIASPYDGTNASGGTYALAKYGLYIDDIYSFYGINSATANANFGIYVKGGANNYIAGTLGIGTTAAAEKLHVVTGTTYAAIFNTTVTTASSTRISIGALGSSGGGTGGSAAIGNSTNHSATAQSSLTFYTHDGTTLNEVGRFSPLGYLLVGTTTPAGASRLVVATTTAVDATLTVKAEAANYASIINIEAQNDNGAIYNYIASNTTSLTQHWKISGGAATNTMAFSTGGTERARFNSTGAMVFAGGTTTADGIGITFPATQSASTNANTLDDYEEGTWTPTFGSFDGTYSVQLGTYTKIGRLVTVEVHLAASSIGTSAGNSISVGNFPFTKLAGSVYGASSSVHGTSWATPKTSPNILLPGSSTVAAVYITMFSGASGFLPNYADIGTSGNLLFSMTYMATS